MMKARLAVLGLLFLFAAGGLSIRSNVAFADPPHQDEQDDWNHDATGAKCPDAVSPCHPDRVVFHRTRGQLQKANRLQTAGNLLYWGGPTERTTSTTYAIYWAPAAACGQPSFMSASYQPLIDRYFADVGGNGIY